MLRRRLQYAADVVLTEIFEEPVSSPAFAVLSHIGHEIVKPYPGPDENFLHAFDTGDFLQNMRILFMIDLKLGARFWEEAVFAGAHALRKLLLTGWFPEVCRRSAHVVDVAFEQWILRHKLRFPDDGFAASASDFPSLMICDRAETASAEASPVRCDAEPDFLYGRNASVLIV